MGQGTGLLAHSIGGFRLVKHLYMLQEQLKR